MEELNYVTARRPMLKRAKSFEISSESSSTNNSVDLLGKSLDYSTVHAVTSYHMDEIKEMKEIIANLTNNLQSTQNELDNVILENIDLKKHIAQLAQEVDVLKQICHSPILHKRNLTNSCKKNIRRRISDNFAMSPLLLPDADGQMKESTTHLERLDKRQIEIGQTSKKVDVEPTKAQHCSIAQQVAEVQRNEQASAEDQGSTAMPTEQDLSQFPVESPLQVHQIEQQADQDSTFKKIEKKTKRLFLFGGSQCQGLSSSIRKTRSNSAYECYEVIAFIKPNANVDEILNCAKAFDISPEDRVIICVGQHDSNPISVMSELCLFLKNSNCHVFVLGVTKSTHLNEKKLNDTIRMICKQQVSKCTFVMNEVDKNIDNDYYFITDMCRVINTSLDQYDYNVKFLNFRKRKNLIRLNNNKKFEREPEMLVNRNDHTMLNKGTQTDCCVTLSVSTQTLDINENEHINETCFRDS